MINQKYNIRTQVTINQETEYIIDDGEYQSNFRVSDYEYYRLGIPDIQDYLIKQHEHMKRSEPGFVHPGPTNEQLEKYPALSLAWREFLVVKRICGE
jgi:hypothetical protein